MACTTCKKEPPQVTLRNCAKCTTTPYCSRECQKADWKTHKKTCAKQAGEASSASSARANLSPPKGLEGPVDKPFTRLENGTWLHDRPVEDVYRLLLDAFRMRIEDDYMLEQINTEGTIMAGEPHSLPGFQRFMQSVERRRSLLPPWWTPQHRLDCEKLGMTFTQENWQSLDCSIEKHDVVEHYGDAKFPMQLRMFAEAVLGSGPGGQDGTAMRRMMAMAEGGRPGHNMTVLDMNGLRAM